MPSLSRSASTVILAAALALGGCGFGVDLDPALADAPLPAVADPVDADLADAGAWLFRRNCSACHHIGGESMIGPDLAGVTGRRSMPWIAAMIRNPDSMLVADSIAARMLVQYQVPMANRRLDGARIRALIEFLRRADRGPTVDPGPPHTDTSATTPSGIAWERSGSGRALVLVHGTNLDRVVWHPVVTALVSDRTVVTYDLRSHGRSRDATGPWSDVDDLAGVLDAGGLEHATLVGLSAGAGVALEFALTHPGRVDGLALLAPSVRGFAPAADEVPDVFGPLMAALPTGDTVAIGDAMRSLPTFAVAAADRSLVEAMVRRNLRLFRVDPRWATPTSPPPLERLAEVDVPTVVLVGSEDFAATRRLAQELAAGIPGGRLVTVEGGGHLLTLTDPDRVAAELRRLPPP